MLSAGTGNDQFIFNASFGKDTIVDFEYGDKIVFDQSMFGSINEIMTHIQFDGSDTVINVDANNAITVKNITTLSANDFLLQ